MSFLKKMKILTYIKTRLRHFILDTTKDFIEQTIFNNINYNISDKTNKGVVYTCLTGGYDSLGLLTYVSSDLDYICFTDSRDLLQLKSYGAWKILPIQFSDGTNQIINRWHKTHPHILFPNYDYSIYIDSNINILNSNVFSEIFNKRSMLVLPIHFEQQCIYEESKLVLKSKLATKDSINKIITLLKDNDFPKNYGMNENNLIYREHNNPEVIRIMEEWWDLIYNYCNRDQLSFAYILWKHNIKPSDIAIRNLRINNPDILMKNHKKRARFK